MARSVGEALATGRHLLVEAGTGVGKSLAYLVPAILHAVSGSGADGSRRVVVSTFTRALQEQLARKDLPVLERAFEAEGVAFRHALLMGSENYLCVQRLEQARRLDGGADLEALERHAATAVSGLRSEIPFPVPEPLWGRVRRERDVCLGARGPFWEQCLYRRDLVRAREADLVVVNHALFFLDLASGGRILPPHGVVVLDEAHRAEEAAAQQFGARLGPGAVTRLLRDIVPSRRRGRSDGATAGGRRGRGRGLRGTTVAGASRLAAASRQVEGASEEYFASVRRLAQSQGGRGAGATAVRLPPGALDRRGLANAFGDLETALEDSARETDDLFGRGALESLRQRSVDLRGRLDLFTTQSQQDAVYWVETRGAQDVELAVAPIEVAPLLRQALFEAGRTVVLTSATLSVAGSFAHARGRLGITAAGSEALGSPYDFRRRALLYLPAGMPDPASDPAGWGDAVSAECRRIVETSDGGAFLLFTSYALLDRVHRDLEAEPAMRGRPLLRHQPDAPATDLLERFRASRRGVLLGALTFWQGVDVPGEALRAVVVTRLPFEVPDHPVAKARAAAIAARGGDPFQDDSLPDAILTFRQGFGRLIRSHRDYGLVAVLDPRLTSRAYGARFLESIPACPRTSSLEEVARFFARAGSDLADDSGSSAIPEWSR